MDAGDSQVPAAMSPKLQVHRNPQPVRLSWAPSEAPAQQTGGQDPVTIDASGSQVPATPSPELQVFLNPQPVKPVQPAQASPEVVIQHTDGHGSAAVNTSGSQVPATSSPELQILLNPQPVKPVQLPAESAVQWTPRLNHATIEENDPVTKSPVTDSPTPMPSVQIAESKESVKSDNVKYIQT